MSIIHVLVADSARARFFTMKDGKSLLEVRDWINNTARLHEQQLVSDAPGKAHNSQGAGRHGLENRQNQKEHQMEMFARDIAEQLNQYRKTNQVQELAIIAAPAFLGILRSHLDHATKKLVAYELDKDISQESVNAIHERVIELMHKTFDK